VSRSIAALAWIAFTALLVGCGGDESDLVSEKSVRDCLVDTGIGLQPQGAPDSAAGFAPFFAPDFTAHTKGGQTVNVVVEGSVERARRTAAHVRSAVASLGTSGSGAGAIVVSRENVVAVFSSAPSAGDRDAVRSCLGG
jgi:hypothetical protein